VTAWEEIKKVMTEGYAEGTIEYQLQLFKADDMFWFMRPFLKNLKNESKSFNADPDMAKAIANRRILREMGLSQ